MIGDTTRPRVYCETCGVVLYCDETRGITPNGMRRKLRRIHQENGCNGEIEYAAGLVYPRKRER